jgi:hypothetical protein
MAEREGIAVEELAQSLDRDAPELVASYLARVRSLPTLAAADDDHELAQALRRDGFAATRSAIAGLREGYLIPEALPADTLHLLRRWARLRLPVGVLLGGYRHVHAILQQRAFDVLAARAEPEGTRHQLVERIATYLFAWVDRMSELAAEAHARERTAASGGRDDVRSRVVRELLAGARDDAGPLAYDLAMEHVAVTAAGPQAEAAVGDLATHLGLRWIAVAGVDGVIWAWLGEFPSASHGGDRLLRRFVPDGDVRIGVGDRAAGLGGFRRSHHQACEALCVARRRDETIVHYDDVALEALVMRDETRARCFVERELGDLADRSKRARQLRRTLEAYFLSAQNGAAAAALIGVHEQTISYRLRSIEERLGRPVARRRAELETALRLCSLYEREAR